MAALRRLPSLRPWLAALAAALVVYVGAAHLVWRQGVDDALSLAERIISRPQIDE